MRMGEGTRLFWGAVAAATWFCALAFANFCLPRKRVATRARQRTREARVLPKLLLVVVLVLVLVPPVSLASDLPRDPDYDYDPPAPGTYTLPVVKPAAAGALLDSRGKATNLRDLTRDRVTV